MIFGPGIVLMAIAFPPAPARHGAEYLELWLLLVWVATEWDVPLAMFASR